MLDLSPALQERVVCSITTAIKYEIPAKFSGAGDKKTQNPMKHFCRLFKFTPYIQIRMNCWSRYVRQSQSLFINTSFDTGR